MASVGNLIGEEDQTNYKSQQEDELAQLLPRWMIDDCVSVELSRGLTCMLKIRISVDIFRIPLS